MLRSKSLAILLILAVWTVGCGRSPESARKELGKMSVEYSKDQFVKRAEEDDLVAVDLFLTAGMDPNAKDDAGRTALMAASAQGHEEIVLALTCKGADLNARDNNACTALMYASRAGLRNTAEALLDCGTDRNASDIFGRTALMQAAIMGHAGNKSFA